MYRGYKECRSRSESAASNTEASNTHSSKHKSDTEVQHYISTSEEGRNSPIVTKKDSQQHRNIAGIETEVQKVANTEFSVKPDGDIENIVKNCWAKIHEQRRVELNDRNERPVARNGQSKGWKTIRVFVSSTFTDMHSEREILIKKVFPALREWCEERKFTVIDCDLRWGVPKDSTTRTTICTCMEELDRCYVDNENLPFFINVLSERYGWVPGDNDVPEDIKERYNWVPQVSITHMEILHGAYRFDNPNALFCLRDPSFVKDIPADKLSRFVDKEPLYSCHLKVLKEELLKRFPNQTFVYDCHVDGIDMSTGREKVNIAGLEPFGERVLEFLREAIERQYPDHQLTQDISPAEQEENAHSATMQVKSSFVVGRDLELNALLGYVADGTVVSGLMKDRNKENEDNRDDRDDEKIKEEVLAECANFGVKFDDSRIMSVVGGSGIGKSALLAKLAVIAMTNGRNVLYHHVGSTIESLTPKSIVQRLLLALPATNGAKDGETSEDVGANNGNGKDEEDFDVAKAIRTAMKIAETSNAQLDLIIDGLDELNENQSNLFLEWFPPRFPGNVRCVVSTRDNHYPCIARLESRQSYFFHLDKLSTDAAVEVVTYYMSRFNKSLDPGQMASLLKHSSARLPMWLSVVCEEMRVFGDFATITEKIEGFPDSLEELMQDVLKRLVREDETQFMEKVLSLMYCCKVGVPEDAMLQLLGNLETNENAPMIAWATNRRYLKPFIRTVMKGSRTLIRFASDEFNKAVKQVVLTDDEQLLKWRTHIADFYEFHYKDQWFVLEELPLQLLQAGLWKRMKEFYRKDFRAFNAPTFAKSRHFSEMRCQKFVLRNMPQMSHPVVVCSFCAMRGGLLSPQPFQTHECCAICGSLASKLMNSAEATFCQSHGYRNHLFADCWTCGRSVSLSSNAPGNSFHKLRLCMMCSSGKGALTCCRLLDSP